MNAKVEAGAASLDTAKLAAAALLLIGGIFAFYFFADYSTLLRVLGLLIIGGAAAAIALQTQVGRQLWQFVGDARTEVRKVVWPTRQETTRMTWVVIAVVIIISLVLAGFDFIVKWAIELFLNLGR